MVLYIKKLFLNLSLDEKANVITHGIGLLLAILAAPWLIITAFQPQLILGLGIFMFGMIFMFTSSTLYHLANKDVRKNRWRIVDHISIFILIGSTYTPFILYYYNTSVGLKFLLLHWVIIALGIIFKLVYKTKYELISVCLYLVLGWMVLFIYDDITISMSSTVHSWLIAGGISYTIGVYFYIKTHLAWHHAIWHIFVIGGCFSHYAALYLS